MKSNYKKLGQYIRQVDIRNKEDKKDNLLGVSTRKVFIESIANTVGTNFKKYKIVKKSQFTYVPDTSRRGDKIGIAMLESHEEALVSQAYTVFEIIDNEELLPEYLMMWFRRPEFDRYARYMSHGSVREIFGWDEMCDIELPVPSIEKQREIVQEYNVIVNRIKLNEQLNQKLEDTAQAIYKHWFVDFEFPISAEYATSIGKPELEGKPYKTSGGDMVYCEELEQDIPLGWEAKCLSEMSNYLSRGITPKYTAEGGVIVLNQRCIRNNTIDYSFSRKHNNLVKPIQLNRFLKKYDVLVNSTGVGTLGRVALVKDDNKEMIVDTHVTIVRPMQDIDPMYFWFNLALRTSDIENLAEGSTGQTELGRSNLGGLRTPLAPNCLQKEFFKISNPIVLHSLAVDIENPQLVSYKNILLSKMATIEDIGEAAA